MAIRWKPRSEKDGRLVVLGPGGGAVITLPDGRQFRSDGRGTNGYGGTYRFPFRGRDLPSGTTVTVGGRTYAVPQPGLNYGGKYPRSLPTANSYQGQSVQSMARANAVTRSQSDKPRVQNGGGLSGAGGPTQEQGGALSRLMSGAATTGAALKYGQNLFPAFGEAVQTSGLRDTMIGMWGGQSPSQIAALEPFGGIGPQVGASSLTPGFASAANAFAPAAILAMAGQGMLKWYAGAQNPLEQAKGRLYQGAAMEQRPQSLSGMFGVPSLSQLGYDAARGDFKGITMSDSGSPYINVTDSIVGKTLGIKGGLNARQYGQKAREAAAKIALKETGGEKAIRQSSGSTYSQRDKIAMKLISPSTTTQANLSNRSVLTEADMGGK